mmetsp:Transcript_4106/g.11593  ORF Transcript_4106/g.11593 Transcript_4106/m.11593 type:complete len:225 (-) Transcript_4106:857-1531(-)
MVHRRLARAMGDAAVAQAIDGAPIHTAVGGVHGGWREGGAGARVRRAVVGQVRRELLVAQIPVMGRVNISQEAGRVAHSRTGRQGFAELGELLQAQVAVSVGVKAPEHLGGRVALAVQPLPEDGRLRGGHHLRHLLWLQIQLGYHGLHTPNRRWDTRSGLLPVKAGQELHVVNHTRAVLNDVKETLQFLEGDAQAELIHAGYELPLIHHAVPVDVQLTKHISDA